MPELPEVETIVRELRAALVGARIDNVWVNTAIAKPVVSLKLKRTYVSPVDYFKKNLKGAKIKDISRRGKLIIIELSNGNYVLVHLKMTGQMLLSQAERHRHTHVVLEFNNKKSLHYNDVRRFGFWQLTDQEGLAQTLDNRFKFGPEPLTSAFTVAHLQAGLGRRNSPIKTVLLDQSLVAGLGNIYVDESLHRAGINPLRIASKLAVEEVKRLYNSAREVLKEAVRAGGSSSKDYLRSSGKKGSFQNSHAVYRRTGQPCFNCGEPIERVVINGRSTHYCIRCQS